MSGYYRSYYDSEKDAATPMPTVTQTLESLGWSVKKRTSPSGHVAIAKRKGKAVTGSGRTEHEAMVDLLLRVQGE